MEQWAIAERCICILLTEAIRRQIGAAVLERVFTGSGSVKAKRSRPRIPEAERWFSADRPIRQVHKDHAMFVGGITAILLQSLHPLTMAAIADHSAYQSDPWGRMRRTSHFIAATTFGRPADARAAIAQVARAHRNAAGPRCRPVSAGEAVAAAHRGRPRPSGRAARGEYDPLGPVGPRARGRMSLSR